MFGHGSPRAGPFSRRPGFGPSRIAGRARSLALGVCAGWCLLWLTTSFILADDELNLRLRIAWGGGAPRSWHGSVSLAGGKLAEIVPLGMEADVPGSMQLIEGRVQIIRRTSRQFDGLDLLVTGPADAKLTIELTPEGEKSQPQRMELPLATTVDGVQSTALDDQQNRLVVRRAPGDKLRVSFERDSLVFAPKEELRFNAAPHWAGLPADASLRCQIQVLKARTETEVSNRELEVKTDEHGVAQPIGPVAMELPGVEGPYDVLISLHPKRTAPSIVRAKPLVQRRVQVLVLDSKPPAPAAGEWKTELDIDPANPRWWDRLKTVPQLKLIPGLGNAPLGNGKSKPREHLGQAWVQLEAEGWQAYPLPVSRMGEPHVLEVEYPSDLKQTLAISLLEPNAAGVVTPLGLDSGLDVSEVVGSPRVSKHRLVFWPRTKTPFVLLANRRTDGPAVFGKLRVQGGPAVLAAAPLVKNADNQRLFAAYFDKPLFPENFGAREALDPTTNRSLDDWETFYQGGKRLVEYLKHAGYNGAILSVACEGSAIYPSRLLQATPKYDSGTFFATGQDPLRKDVLEMLLTLFDREGLRLIPAIQFSSPLPELESLRYGKNSDETFDLLDLDGKTWQARFGAGRGLAPYYNPLDLGVQTQMLAVAEELAKRYGAHPAFGGLALQLGPETFAQLPGEEWGADDATLVRFARAAGLDVKSFGTYGRARRDALLSESTRKTWLNWRATQLADFHGRMQQTVAKSRPDATLYLAGADLYTGREMQTALRPALPPRADLADALLRTGISPPLYAERPGMLLLKPQRQAPTSPLTSLAANLEARNSPEAARLFAEAPQSGSLFFHEPLPLRLTSFDEVSPFGAKQTLTWLATLAVPTGPTNRARFVQALAAHDEQSLFDGGWMLPLGQEESLRPILDTFRSLPVERFQTVNPKSTARTQPVTVRTLVKDNRTYCYLVNNSPWPVSVELAIDAPADCQIEPLSRRALAPLSRQAGSIRWTVPLEPYDLAAGVLTSPRVRIDGWQVTLPREVKPELEQQVQQIRARANALKNPLPLAALPNSGFEAKQPDAEIPGWTHADEPGVSIAVDPGEHRGGRQSLVVRSKGPAAWVRSSAFAAPSTGRLSVWVWLRVADPKKQPPLRLAIEGKADGQVYYKFAQVGSGVDVPPLDTRWAPYLFQVDDLPATGLSPLRVGFDLMGPGEVWIDDVQLYDTWFNDYERDELLKNIALADADLAAGRISDCRRFLGGYWSRFLMAHVPAEAPRLAAKPVEPRTAPREPFKPAAPKPSILERLRLPFYKTPTGPEVK